MDNHREHCRETGGQKIVMPEEGDVLTFNDAGRHNKKTFESAFILIYDFEALQVSFITIILTLTD